MKKFCSANNRTLFNNPTIYKNNSYRINVTKKLEFIYFFLCEMDLFIYKMIKTKIEHGNYSCLLFIKIVGSN